jgi:hypothetical protein
VTEAQPTPSPAASQPDSRKRPAVVALGAGVLYGSWAAWANHEHGLRAMLKAAGAQAALSVAATLGLVLILEYLFRRAPSPRVGFWLASSGTSSIAVIALVAGHTLAGTPNIWTTIAPSVVVGTVFYFGYSLTLLRTRALPAP